MLITIFWYFYIISHFFYHSYNRRYIVSMMTVSAWTRWTWSAVWTCLFWHRTAHEERICVHVRTITLGGHLPGCQHMLEGWKGRGGCLRGYIPPPPPKSLGAPKIGVGTYPREYDISFSVLYLYKQHTLQCKNMQLLPWYNPVIIPSLLGAPRYGEIQSALHNHPGTYPNPTHVHKFL